MKQIDKANLWSVTMLVVLMFSAIVPTFLWVIASGDSENTTQPNYVVLALVATASYVFQVFSWFLISYKAWKQVDNENQESDNDGKAVTFKIDDWR